MRNFDNLDNLENPDDDADVPDLRTDPPPDLLIDINIGNDHRYDKMSTYAKIGVPEVWQCDDTFVQGFALTNGEYTPITISRLFAGLPLFELSLRLSVVRYLDLAFRDAWKAWLETNRQKHVAADRNAIAARVALLGAAERHGEPGANLEEEPTVTDGDVTGTVIAATGAHAAIQTGPNSFVILEQAKLNREIRTDDPVQITLANGMGHVTMLRPERGPNVVIHKTQDQEFALAGEQQHFKVPTNLRRLFDRDPNKYSRMLRMLLAAAKTHGYVVIHAGKIAPRDAAQFCAEQFDELGYPSIAKALNDVIPDDLSQKGIAKHDRTQRGV